MPSSGRWLWGSINGAAEENALPEDANGVRQGVQEGRGARERQEGLAGRRWPGQDQETTKQPVAPAALYFEAPERKSQLVKAGGVLDVSPDVGSQSLNFASR